MSGFSGEWLDLRERADAAARSAALADMLRRWLPHDAPSRVTDLGAGTGSALRWIAPRLAPRQRWRLVDHEPRLLGAAAPRLRAWGAARGMAVSAVGEGLRLGSGIRVGFERVDLAAGLPDLDGSHLVSASALADLVSRVWLAALADACAAAGAAVLLSLCFDGRVGLRPHHPLDARVRDAVNRHQRGDKGFGAALGPDAAAAAATLLRDRGYRVTQGRSDWCLGAQEAALERALLAGWVAAARELPGADPPALLAWREARSARAEAGGLRVRVGHVDLLAIPPAGPASR